MPETNSVPDEAVAAGIAIVVGLIVLFVVIAIQAVLSYLVVSCLNRIPPAHRKQQPGLVWLLLIPCFPLIWNFFVYPKLAESFKSYFAAQGRTDVGDCGSNLALAYCICVVCGLIPVVGYIAAPASLVLVILFLVKAFQLKNMIPPTAA